MDLPAAQVATARARPARSLTLALFAAATLAGATLVFLVQPMVARMVLPLFGGSQAVWTTAMLFFQGVLLAGYAYAHASTRLLGPARQPLLHGSVLAAAALALPIGRGLEPPPPGTSPSLWLLAVLAVAVGAPFFVVTTASPLLQRWLAASGHAAGRDPYFLYAAGNAGSLLALLAYPFVVEPLLTLEQQARLWSLGYLAFVVLSLGCLVVARRGAGRLAEEHAEAPAPAWRTRLRWVAIALVPSSLMLGVTTHVSTDVASAPLLWVLPLAVYLLTFVVAFARRPLVTPALAGRLLPLPAAVALLGLLGAVAQPIPIALVLHLVVLFLVGALAHGRLAEERPAPARLTEFYVLLSLGGVLGGALNALLAPLLFDSVLEYPLVLVLALLLRPGSRGGPRDLLFAGALLIACFVGLALVSDSEAAVRAMLVAVAGAALVGGRKRPRRLALGLAGLVSLVALGGPSLHAERTFFGVLRVVEEEGMRSLYHGTTLHGQQRMGSAEPLSYYSRRGPLGDMFRTYPRLDRVDAIGLGVGTLAAYGRPGGRIVFYELDPAVARLASEYFSFLRESPAEVEVVVGDGRQALAAGARARASDLVVVDAFSSDSIPVHLLTREALELYAGKLRARGLLAFHVSNRHLDVASVVVGGAGTLGLAAAERRDAPATGERAASHWVVLARSPAVLEPLLRLPGWRVPDPPGGRVWTDDYSNILAVVDWSR